MTKPIPPLDLSWLLIESPAGTTHVGAMLLFKKPAGRGPIVREIVEAYRACPPAPPFNYVPELLVRGVPHFREVASWDPYYHIGHLALPAGASSTTCCALLPICTSRNSIATGRSFAAG